MITLDPLRRRAAYRDPNVLRWLAGYTFSLLGDQAFFVALSWAATKVVSPTGVGAILAAGAVPRALLLLPGGAVADRLGPKRLLVTSDVARTLIMLALAGVLAVGRPVTGVLVVAAVLFGVVDALFLPAVGALPRYLVDDGELARLQGIRSVVQRMTVVLGGPLAGFSIAEFGLAGAFGVNAGLFAVSVLALVATRIAVPVGAVRAEAPEAVRTDAAAAAGAGAPAAEPAAAGEAGGSCRDNAGGHLLTEVVAGLRYLRQHRSLGMLLVLTAGVEFGFSGPLNTGLPILASARDWGAQGVGLVLGGFGAGAATAAGYLAVVGRVPKAGLTMLSSVLVSGAATAAVGFAPTVLVACCCGCVAGIGAGLGGAVLSTMMLSDTDREHIGRVVSLFSLAVFAGTPVSYTVCGLVAAAFGPAAAFALGGGIAVAATVIGLTNRGLRHARMPVR